MIPLAGRTAISFPFLGTDFPVAVRGMSHDRVTSFARIAPGNVSHAFGDRACRSARHWPTASAVFC